MSARNCPTCVRHRGLVTMTEGGLARAARIAVQDPCNRNLRAVTKLKANLGYVRQALVLHEAECQFVGDLA